MRLNRMPQAVFSDDGLHALGLVSPDGSVIWLPKTFATLAALQAEFTNGTLTQGVYCLNTGDVYVTNGTVLVQIATVSPDMVVNSRDTLGRATSVTRAGVTTTYTYNSAGKVATESSGGKVSTYNYVNGLLSSIVTA